jgi:hypothetical protein
VGVPLLSYVQPFAQQVVVSVLLSGQAMPALQSHVQAVASKV